MPKQEDMFADEIKVSWVKAVGSKLKFWGSKTKDVAIDVAENEHVREIGVATKEATVEAIKSPAMKHVLGGMIAGAMIGTLVPIPFVGTLAGAGIGASIGLYRWFTQ